MGLVDVPPVPMVAGTNFVVDLHSLGNLTNPLCSVKLQNESSLTLTVVIGRATHRLGAYVADVYPLNCERFIEVLPTQLQTPAPPPGAAQLLVTVSTDGDAIPGIYPAALARAVTVTQPQIKLSDLNFGAGVGTQTTDLVPAGTHALVISAQFAKTFNAVTVTGHATQAQYFPTDPSIASAALTGGAIAIPVDTAHDQQFDILVNAPGAAAMHVAALLDTAAVWITNAVRAPAYVSLVDTAGNILGSASFLGLPVRPGQGTWTNTTTTIAASGATQILAANANRRGAIIVPNGLVNLSLHGQTTVIAQIPASGYWEMPAPITTAALDVTNLVGSAFGVHVHEIT